jgi:protein-L-isoaspartate O-methyltransferase
MMEDPNRYVGTELELFERAVNWKSYWTSKVVPYIGGSVLEVGAGIGANTAVIAKRLSFSRWVCLEPDAQLAEQCRSTVSGFKGTEVICGKIDCLAPEARFDSILYFDVLEHIPDDAGELTKAWARVRAGGHLVVVCPAHDSLYSEFDRRIGHVRRYDKRSLRKIAPPGSTQLRLFYLDSLGMMASLANRLLLKQSMPEAAQIRFWDTVIVSISRRVDPLLAFSVGKTIVAVWRKNPGQ